MAVIELRDQRASEFAGHTIKVFVLNYKIDIEQFNLCIL